MPLSGLRPTTPPDLFYIAGIALLVGVALVYVVTTFPNLGFVTSPRIRGAHMCRFRSPPCWQPDRSVGISSRLRAYVRPAGVSSRVIAQSLPSRPGMGATSTSTTPQLVAVAGTDL
jgi:hypothetical protein